MKGIKRTPNNVAWHNSNSALREASFVEDMTRARSQHFNIFGYPKNRGLAVMKGHFHFDTINFLQGILKKKRNKLYVLNAGGGFLNLDNELKARFGNKLFLTSIGLASGHFPPEEMNAIYSDMRKTKEEWVKKKSKDLIKQLKEFDRRTKKVDQYAVSFFENFSTPRRYDVIFDFLGPMRYSPFSERVIEQYGNILKNGGCAITPKSIFEHRMGTYDFKKDAHNFIKFESGFGKGSEYSKKHGYYLRLEKCPFCTTGELILLRKVKNETK